MTKKNNWLYEEAKKIREKYEELPNWAKPTSSTDLLSKPQTNTKSDVKVTKVLATQSKSTKSR